MRGGLGLNICATGIWQNGIWQNGMVNVVVSLDTWNFQNFKPDFLLEGKRLKCLRLFPRPEKQKKKQTNKKIACMQMSPVFLIARRKGNPFP